MNKNIEYELLSQEIYQGLLDEEHKFFNHAKTFHKSIHTLYNLRLSHKQLNNRSNHQYE